MESSAGPKNVDVNDVCGYFLQIENSMYPASLRNRNSVIKYTKIPDFDFDSNVSWPANSYTLAPRLRRIITLEEPEEHTTRSLPSDIRGPCKMISSSYTKRKIVTIAEDNENNAHPRYIKPKVKTSEIIKKDVAKSKPFNVRKVKALPSCEAQSPKLSTTKDEVRNKIPLRNNLNKNAVSPNGSVRNVNYVKNGRRSNFAIKKPADKPKCSKPVPPNPAVSDLMFFEEMNNPCTKMVIRVPLDDCKEVDSEEQINNSDLSAVKPIVKTRGTQASNINSENIATKPKVDKVTEMDDMYFGRSCLSIDNTYVQTDKVKEAYGSLDIPNVTLNMDKSDVPKDDIVIYSKSLPNLQVPEIKITPNKPERKVKDYCKSTSYIIGSATVTYTTKQKINFHVVSSNDESSPSLSPSPLAYPLSVVSVFKKEYRDTSVNDTKSNKNKNNDLVNQLREVKSLNCSYVVNSNKLVKPSEIISSIDVNSGLLQGDYICEQFQRELNFIDSFFESLQFLESCSLSDNCFSDTNVKNWVSSTGFEIGNPEYGSFLSDLNNDANADDSETMASKSLCLLNLLIRDEQRRAKNLLFVLKMREDALKDFTKSQILWLEKKKKQDNTDVSTLKKKQRGALLKLQHECGEMQRMRKALLALSEKRKVALMKTKKNIELKLTSNVDVDQILLGKKKLKRNSPTDRNSAPLKCFDLSSSGCEDTFVSRSNSEATLPALETVPASAEKCVQTGDSILVDSSTDTAAEHFVAVDGGYLNILFQNLSLPQIFSSGKSYEVNEEALRNILHSANSNSDQLNENVIGSFLEKLKKKDVSDMSSSPSTARSLVEEFDQYYKGLNEDSSITRTLVPDYRAVGIKEVYVQSESVDAVASVSTMTAEMGAIVLNSVDDVAIDSSDEGNVRGKVGPLLEPPGAADVDMEDAVWQAEVKTETAPANGTDSSVSSNAFGSTSSVSSLSFPPHCEAEELRRQQLAIEREIKALEQQQCQLMVVREIPDKPPPPYTPPVEPRSPKLPRKFLADETTEEKVQRHFSQPNDVEPVDAFDVFVKDFCLEAVERNTVVVTDKPWDQCNLLPQMPSVTGDDMVKKATQELSDVLAGVPPTIVSGVGARRSDHIDDILFTEWRRCEPEWTALHQDEITVKNQIFESIFQKILSETIEEYKRTVAIGNMN